MSAVPADPRPFARPETLALALVLLGLAVIYLPGLGNPLLFDDGLLTERAFRQFGSLVPLRPRAFSYGTFVWLDALLGEGWWKQRLVNLAIHVAVSVALYALYRELLRHIEAPAGGDTERYESSPALAFAVGFFALNPVAVYAVAYLIERSILLATFFVVLGFWCFARGLRLRQPWLQAAALPCYALAMASKETAILAPLAALPLYIVVARPDLRRLARGVAAGAILIGLAALALWQRLAHILGAPFDEYSRVYLAQLAALDPSAPAHAYGLSVMNEAWLFFRYGFEWMLPWSGWMSIQLRPAFPPSFLSFPQVLGALGYAAVLAGGFVLLLRHRDWRALLGFSLLVPALLFATEFATVWIQDPFVLYRSYLWAIGIPGIVFLIAHGPSWRVLLALGAGLGSLLAWQASDRVYSLQSVEAAWTDAITKLPSDPRAMGRWLPYLNRGAAYVDASRYDLAMHDFEASTALGDLGMGAFNQGAILATRGQHAQALAAFERAERSGYDLYNLPFQRGLTLLALGRVPEAQREFQKAASMQPPSPTRELALLALGRTSMQVGKPDDAVRALEELAQVDPGNREGRYLLGMAYIMQRDPARAVQVLDRLLLDGANGRAFYARALANYSLKRKAQALADIDNAIRAGPVDQNLIEWRAKIAAMP